MAVRCRDSTAGLQQGPGALGRMSYRPWDTFCLEMFTLTSPFLIAITLYVISSDAKLFRSIKNLTHGPSLNVPKQPLR